MPRVIEFFLKDDAAHDPLIAPDQIVADNIAAPQEVGVMTELARLTFDILSHAWRKRDVLLVDLKIEFGRLAGGENQGQLVIADVIDNDSWRIWPQGREELMLDKQIYRNLEAVDDEALERVKHAYERVAELVGTFPVMRPGMAAVIADSASRVDRANDVVNMLGQLGLPTIRHVASPSATPGFVLQLTQQLEASFARLILIAVGENELLRSMLEETSSAPVLDGTHRAATAGDAVRETFGTRRHRALWAHALDAGQCPLERSSCRCFVAAANAGAAGSVAWLVGSPELRTSRYATTSCSESCSASDANPRSSSSTRSTHNGASIAAISRAATT